MASTERLLGLSGVVRRTVNSSDSALANRRWWDADAGNYQEEHGQFLGDDDFVWCPELLREADARLLGEPAELRGARALEVGCGAASCARWLTRQGAVAIGLDLACSAFGAVRSSPTLAR